MDFQVEWFDKIASTNAAMRDAFRRGEKIESGRIIAAREQTDGRGRQDRKWLSAPDTNLCFSLFVQTGAELASVPSLTLAAALATTEMLNAQGIAAAPKWPNDVLVDGKKICGILSERVEPEGIIVGIGLNVNMSSEEAEAIGRPATSMLIETGTASDLSKTLDALLDLLDYWIGEWEQGGFSALREPWVLRAGPIGKPLTVRDGDIKKSGTLAGFGDHGELLLKTKNGIETIWSGDVS